MWNHAKMSIKTLKRKIHCFCIVKSAEISCRRNGVCYRVSCLVCLAAGKSADVTAFLDCACYYGESAKNMHCRSKEHVCKFNSKSEKTRSESAFYKHLVNSHGGKCDDMNFSDYFEIQILKAYKKPFTRLVEEGTFITSHRGELLNSKNEWHQPKLVRTTTQVVQGGAESLRGGGRGVGGQPLGRGAGGRTQGQWWDFFKIKHVCGVFFLVQKSVWLMTNISFTSRSDQDSM